MVDVTLNAFIGALDKMEYLLLNLYAFTSSAVPV